MCPTLDILEKIDQAIAWEGELSAPAEHAVAVLKEARAKIERMHADRLMVDRRIHNQRAMLQAHWEIIEMRAQYKRAWYPSKLLSSILRNRLNHKRTLP